MKYKKFIIIVLTILISSLTGAVFAIIPRTEEIHAERDRVSKERDDFAKKRDTCTEKFESKYPFVDSLNLTDCGHDLAEKALNFETLGDIYRHYCRGAVYGCAYPSENIVYVCLPGTSVYDRRYIGSIGWYDYYWVFSYSCTSVQSANTVRHELLHLVFESLPQSKKDALIKKLENYRSEYGDELSEYPSWQRDGELFVRVGADQRKIDDIELIDEYTKVVAAYTNQKKSYYGDLVNMADGYFNRYQDLLQKYTIIQIVIISIAVINFIFLIFVIVVIAKTKKRASAVVNPVLSKQEPSSHNESYIDKLEHNVSKVRSKNASKTRREFEAFKKENGLIDR